MKIIEIFKKNGPIACRLQGYESRPEQIEMVRAIYETIVNEEHLIVEAGTGIGKSLAYMVPFIYWAIEQDKRVIISTFTKALQQQLVEKDIPFLQESLDIKFNYALCVGGQNYLCMRRLDQSGQHGLFETKTELKQLEDVFEWRMQTRTGIISELHFEPLNSVWGKVCREADLCMGKNCLHHEDCFYRKAKKKQCQSQILVVNHHLFFANLASGEKALPEYDAIVFDEAHTLEEVATNYLGVEVSNYKLKFLLDSISSPRTGKGLLGSLKNIAEVGSVREEDKKRKIEKLVADVRIAADVFFSNIIEKCPPVPTGSLWKTNSFRIRQPNFIPNTLTEPLLILSSYLKTLLPILKDCLAEEKIEINALSTRAKIIGNEVETILAQSLRDYVYWVETIKSSRYSRYILHASPVNVGELMKEMVFNRISPVVLTSATLSTNGSFNYFKERIGLDETSELILGSPFNFKENALLYISPSLSDPSNETKNYTNEVARQITQILEIVRGRTFVLFTSFKMMNEIHNSLKDFPELKILRQGDLPRYKMLKKFKEGVNLKNGGFVLFGTNTFWQGVDVPGRALECVIIVKLPFAAPFDPVTETKIEYLQKEGKDPFLLYQVPQAIIMLKQGFGRLIRTKEDIGVVAILDPRLRTRSYGKMFLKSLPECKITSDIEEIDKFFSKIKLHTVFT
ncbi:hypothetical protein AUJ66_07540 [Candidatus Desantisbacteria bacterium CG1_02_38_46]|uniref:DNA 5'-3' helicase n=1 Tax=Candidatus Desantisbacteria bacterium CG1_02_38_46 TaxID=1817893 RepID=A0A1J4SCR5_9BACT|nr:MAG: hypothetical protein AUJ66_07540 [Candidatus Desantisbacteria bacterium CG1_02_38_46]